ncbi:cytochrome P450 [Ramlibacter sp. WS9]|uniref:cytochrome P450 n=1 Tax=Ramlibacter sp. WS9 TaxID=1882741 RepID=UPI001141E22D|nr:cytochrome P450 [Ramlibacter sp. WS9]ROZ71319.1 cytochrome P450 [Ramlibacter sp. WS9]
MSLVTTAAQPSVPAHVPPERVRDVDLYNLPGAQEDVHLAWKRIQDEAPDLYFTPRNGGYWVLNRAALMNQVWPDHERFSSAKAIGIPNIPQMPAQIPIEVDPPQHRYFRHPINVAVSPRAIQSFTVEARALAIELIEGFKARGECEFVAEFAQFLPITIFLRLVDLPVSDRPWLLERAELMVRSADMVARMQAYQEIVGYLDGWVRKRRDQPGTDLISQILQIRVGDRPITHEEAVSESALVLFGGLDTVASTMGFFARFLATHPAHRQQLIDDPALIPQAIEELLRRHSIPSLGRQLTEDMVLDGVQLKAGDRVMITVCMHGLDERAWPDPLTVDFKRNVQDHLAFGKGVHKCPGANLARAELRVFLEEWLKRIPDFRIKPGEAAVSATGPVAGMMHLPLVWPVQSA